MSRPTPPNQTDLFAPLPPAAARRARFPENLAHPVRRAIWRALVESSRPLLITGYSSLEQILSFLSERLRTLDLDGAGCVRLLIGHEPRLVRASSLSLSRPTTLRVPNGVAAHGETERAPPTLAAEARDYWLTRGISLLQASELLDVVRLLEHRDLEVRTSHRRRIHAKLFAADDRVLIGSSNLSRAGLDLQLEANVVFRDADEPEDAAAARALGEDLWCQAIDWKDGLARLLDALLRKVTWEEALARAASDLLEGSWADPYLSELGSAAVRRLWPSQRAGIAQAMWLIENVGGALVADAAGSGKTRLGAFLLRALAMRQLRIGRAGVDSPVVVCPPNLRRAWKREGRDAAVRLEVHSHGHLSQTSSASGEEARADVAAARILGVDEAHNFLNHSSSRTRALATNTADHVLLFTATPLNRSALDLLRMVELLGADNFSDAVLEVLARLARRRARGRRLHMSEEELEVIRRGLGNFVLRRTRSELNALVDAEPQAYQGPLGRIARYPRLDTRAYTVEDTPQDRATAREIQRVAEGLRGLIRLRKPIRYPEYLAAWGVPQDAYLQGRLSGARALGIHQVLASMRSSRAALLEHLLGTEAALEAYGLGEGSRVKRSGGLLATVTGLGGPTQVHMDVTPPPWLVEHDAWMEARDEELGCYERIRELADELSDTRLASKARHVLDVARRHRRVVVFDHRLITLAILKDLLGRADRAPDILVATGASRGAQRRIMQRLAPGSSDDRPLIALCSDAMSEGVNLQSASVVVHLDLPTVIRIAEQRTGRVDRMDSPHDTIEIHWPDDSEPFRLRADEHLVVRHRETQRLLGGNLELPEHLGAAPDPVDIHTLLRSLEERARARLDAFEDVFKPVRELVEGPSALVSSETYEAVRGSTARALAWISVIGTTRPWAFLAIGAADRGAPRWVFVDPEQNEVTGDLHAVTERLRQVLGSDAAEGAVTDDAVRILGQASELADAHQERMMPLRKHRALEEMRAVLRGWAGQHPDAQLADRAGQILAFVGEEPSAAVADRQRALFEQDELVPDLERIADGWLALIRPRWQAYLQRPRRSPRPAQLAHLRRDLLAEPLDLDDVQRFHVEGMVRERVDRRVVAAIVGVGQRGAYLAPASP